MNVEEYIHSLFTKDDAILDKVLESIHANGMRNISVPPEIGKLLTLLVKISGAKEILEIGALGGYSGICLVRGLREEGHLTSLELKEEYAQLAHENLQRAGFGDRVTYYTGEALKSLDQLEKNEKRFDFIFIDADKENYPNYLDRSIRLANPGALIVGDNVLQRGQVCDASYVDLRTENMRAFNQRMANDPDLESIILPVGQGLSIGRVKESK
ncbi:MULTISPECIES: O-methyltransferase [Metabacillus]|uniref:Methyltransferase n=2 Tax=Metabacillus TaxID=2675233 RepID=A0A179T2G8_9BACI|nr:MULTISPECIES: O-methyltransferase [Metabacillus]OAS87951.1 methyltransferase [Metabacillus litoralis]QNF27074.1 O-methyltransferase [Metabacillus sp. KUDC1714]